MNLIGIPFIIAGLVGVIYFGRRWNRQRRKDPDGFPRPGTVWKNKTTKTTFVVEQPVVRIADNKPVNPVVRRGFISVVWPKDTFDKHFK